MARRLGATLQTEHGLSLSGFEALRLLAEADGGRLKRVDLVRALGLTPSGVTRLLDGLEDDGLVARAACPVDRRVMYAQLTQGGEERLRAASCGHDGSVRALLEEHLTDGEIEDLAATLAKLPGAGPAG